MKKMLFAFLLIANAATAQLQKFYSDAMAAYKAKDYPAFYTNIKEANKLHPYHEAVLYQLGIAAALTGKKEEAIQHLKKAILINADFKLDGIADFNAIKDTPEFKMLLALQKEWQKPLVHSTTAFTLKDRGLHTEGIDYDAESKTFYLGSIHKRKVVRVTADGKASDFCPPAFDGMTSVFGVKVDTRRHLLWACASPMEEMENYDSTARSAIFQFDLTSGKLLHKFTAIKSGVYGDLILSKKGVAYISDGKNNEIVTVNEKTGQIEPFFSSTEFWNVQGIVFSPDEKYLFVADYVKGIFRLNVKTRELIEIKSTVDVSLKGVDGLYFFDNGFIAVQNGVTPLRSTRYTLNKEFDQIIKFEIIDRNHPDFGEPTLGVVDGNNFYYIANSQWSGYDDKHQIKPNDQLKDIVILKYTMR